MKEYMKSKSLHVVRETFRARTQLVEGIKGNFKNLYRGNDLRCQGCRQEVDTQSHVLQCMEYEDLREDMDMKKDDDMIKYFRKVLNRRMKEQGEAREPAQQDLHWVVLELCTIN